VVRNDHTQSGDVDILVDVDPLIGFRFVTLAERLEASLEQHVDLVSSRAMKPNLLNRSRLNSSMSKRDPLVLLEEYSHSKKQLFA
jgi:predicted nucleotidyltransferase